MKMLVIKDYLYRAKTILRGISLIAKVNGALKAHQLRAGLQRLQMHYKEQAETHKFQYHEKAAIDEFRHRLLNLNPTNNFPKKCGDLRIFWVGANRDQDESGFLQALRRLATVIELHNWKDTYGQWFWDDFGRVRTLDPAIIALNDRTIKSQIEDELKKGSIDLLMGQMWANYISKETLAWVHDHGIPVINVSMDDRLPENWDMQGGTRLGAVGLASVTDLVLTTSSETCAWYGIEGCPAVFWPLASDPATFCPEENFDRDIDVLFIGNKYGIRESIISKLNKQGVAVECYGAGWLNGPATAEQSAALYKRARIVLGVGTVGYCDDIFTMKLRDFDAPMSGALYLTHRCPDLAQLYQEGKEIECYATPEEAARKIHYYLVHPKELSQIAKAGHSKALSRDTWIFRLQATFFRLGLLVASPANLPEIL